MTEQKALEVLKSWLQLAYHNADGTDECCAELYEALQTVFALITRQQADNENLKVENQSLRSAANSLKMHYEEAQVEIERLEERSVEVSKTIKSEAVKEFAERLKCGVPQEYGVIRCSDVDNLVKEMTGKESAQ